MSKEISLKNKDHSKRDTTSNLDIAYPETIPKNRLKNNQNNDMQSFKSNYETKTNRPQGTGEKAKESIQHPELDIKRLIHASGPNSEPTSSTSSINSSSLSSPINQSTSPLNSITISVINKNVNEKVTTPKGKKSSSLSPPPPFESNVATKQTNDSSSKNKNGSNSTTESSVNPNPTFPLFREARCIMDPNQAPLSINDPSLNIKKMQVYDKNTSNMNLTIRTNTLYQEKYEKFKEENTMLKVKLSDIAVKAERQSQSLKVFQFMSVLMFNQLDIASYTYSQDTTILHYGVLLKKSNRLMGGYDQRYVVIVPGKLFWFKGKNQLSQNEIIQILMSNDMKYILLNNQTYVRPNTKTPEVFTVIYNKIIQHPATHKSTYQDHDETSSQLSTSTEHMGTRRSISSEVELYEETTNQTQPVVTNHYSEKEITFKCSTEIEASVFIDAIRNARDQSSEDTDDMMKKFNSTRNELLKANNEDVIYRFLLTKLEQPFMISVDTVKEILSLEKGLAPDLNFEQLCKDIVRDNVSFNNKLYNSIHGDSGCDILFHLAYDLYQAFPHKSDDVISSTKLLSAIKHMLFLSCRTQCSGDALEGLKALIGCDPVFDKYRVITSNPQQPATLFTIEDHRTNGPCIRFESIHYFNITTQMKKNKVLFVAEVNAIAYRSLSHLDSYKLSITLRKSTA